MATKPLSDLTATWNAGGTTFTAVKMNVTDTASAAGSLLIDLQVGGTSQFRVSKGGRVTALGRATIDTLTIGLGGQTAVASNTALGFEALNSASLTGANNVGVGNAALRGTTTGNNNSALGWQALISNTTGSGNTAVGKSTLPSNTTGNDNTGLGEGAAVSNVAGNENTAIGKSALLYFNTSGNTAVGFHAAAGSTTVANNTGSGLVAVGRYALTNNTSGYDSNAFGNGALYSTTTGFQCVSMGNNSLFANTTGANNAAFGYGAGDATTTGSRNTIIGANTDTSAVGGNDQTVIGEGLTGKGDDTFFCGGTNGAYNEKNVTTWETTSDARLKKNIVSNGVGLEVISQIDVRNFEYRTPEEITDFPASAAINQPGVQLGVIAQELRAVLPECVTENSTGVLSVNTDPLVWYLINAVQQLSAEVKALKGK